MLQKIEKRIKAIDEAIEWVRRNKPEVFDSLFIQMAEERRKLRKLAETERDNPAIAAWGKSQVGKSYLMSCMLQKVGEPFMVEDGGMTFNYIDEMNPITHETEATGVVTRFSHYSRNPEVWSAEHPIMMRSLSLTDIILILCEGYYIDLKDYRIPDNINGIGDIYYQRYVNMPLQAVGCLKADDVLELKSYLSKYVNNAQSVFDSNYFERIALVIDRIPINDYCQVFAILWNNDQHLTALFSRLLALLQRLMFRREIYLPASALLHLGNNENSILSVECLNCLGNADSGHVTDLFLRDAGGFVRVTDVSKSELSAICAEVVFKISDDFVKSESEYDFTGMAADTAERVTKGKIKKTLLKKADLLDFPGARSRGGQSSLALEKPIVLCEVFLRGKVAYLFNKYSESRMLNILLYCHDNRDNEVKTIPGTLNDWVNTYVGSTPEKRAENIASLDGIPPLFYIATKFNIDMKKESKASANQPTAVANRWKERFIKVLYKGCLNGESVGWVNDWTAPCVPFQNSFLLRDFKYSGENDSNIYKGFQETGKEQSMIISPEFFKLLRSTFCQVEAEHTRFFSDPALSWDVATTINNDGTLYIIEKLSKVSEKILEVRNAQFEVQMEASAQKVNELLDGYYVKQTEEETLRENIKNAYAIFREMDFACTADKCFFGHLIQALQITEADLKDEIHRLVHFGELHDIIHQFQDEYDIILQRVGDKFSNCKKEEDYWNVLMEVYDLITMEETQQYLISKGVDFQKLIGQRFVKRIPSAIIADRAYKAWCRRIYAPGLLGKLTAANRFDAPVMNILLEKLVDRSEALHLTDDMASRVAPFTDILDLGKINESLVADILANCISEFVLNFGYDKMTQDKRENVKHLWSQYKLPVFNKVGTEKDDIVDLAAIFERAVNNPNALAFSFENNFNRWMEYMFISFVADSRVKRYNKEENDKLFDIMTKLAIRKD